MTNRFKATKLLPSELQLRATAMKMCTLWSGVIFASLVTWGAPANPEPAPSECGAPLVASGLGVHAEGADDVNVYSLEQNSDRVRELGLSDTLTAAEPWLVTREEWLVFCDNDSMTDKRTCRVVGGPSLASAARDTTYAEFELTGSGGVTAVCVNGNDFPGRVGAIRVGETRAYQTDQAGCIRNRGTVKGILARLVVGTRLRTRHVTWPNDVYVDDDYRVTPVMLGAISLGRCLFSH